MKIGIFAGTFDPIHEGHIVFAKTAVQEAGLDKVVIVAEKEPYRKKPFASWDHRQAMIERATESVNQVDHDYGFAAELSHQHTMQNMLTVAEHHYGDGNEYWFLCGSDIFEHIHVWQDIAKDSEYAGFVVALRDDHTETWLSERREQAESHGIKGKILVIDNHQPHTSSSKIRQATKMGTSISEVSPGVQRYIQSHNLYK